MCLGRPINKASALRPRQLSSPAVIGYHNPPVRYPCSMPHATDGSHNSCSADKISNSHTIIVFFPYNSDGAAKEKVGFNG
jgi:hypothetical protein